MSWNPGEIKIKRFHETVLIKFDNAEKYYDSQSWKKTSLLLKSRPKKLCCKREVFNIRLLQFKLITFL